MPFVYSKAPFKHCKRAMTVFPFDRKLNQKYREEDPLLFLFKLKRKANKSQITTVLHCVYSRSYCTTLFI